LFALLLVAASAAAQDDEAPTVVGPKDLPGADVIIKDGDTYTLDSTGSTDNVGISYYEWEVTDPDDNSVIHTSITPTYDWTPSGPGIHKVLASAVDAHGNVGYYVYAVDVVEVIPAQLIANTDVSYDHSVAVTGGTLEYRNSNIEVTGGRKGEGVSIQRGEQLTESLTPKGVGGHLGGYWGPYSTGGYYGYVYEDRTTVLTGSMSLRNSGGNYQYGFTYYFDQAEDLTDYNAFVFWLKTGYNPYGRFYYCYIYSDSGYGYRYYYKGYEPMARGWYGIYFDLDLEKVGYGYDYGLDLSAVTSIRVYMYNYMYNGWIDCAYFDKSPRGDNITESATPSGEWGGYWSGFSTTTHSYVGSASVTRYVSGYTNMYYYWNMQSNGKYADLSPYNALKLYTYYSYYYAYTYGFYVYDANGRYAYWNMGGSYNYFHYYATYYHARWFCMNMPFDQSATSYQSSGFDWTNVRYMRFYVYFPSGSTLWMDGLEFYYSQSAGGSGPPTLSEDIPHGVYALEDGELKMTSSAFTSPEPWGAFVRCDNKLTIKSTTFDGLWGTQHPTIQNEGQTYGGILAFDSSVNLEDVTITKASSSGLYIENCDLVAKNLDISGHSRDFMMSAGLIVAFSGTPVGKTNTVSITASEFHDSPQGSGLMVLSQNARGDATVDIDDVYAYKNQIYGIVIEVTGWTGNLTVSVSDSEFELNGGSGFTFSAHDAIATPRTQVGFKVETSDAIENGAYGFLFQGRHHRPGDLRQHRQRHRL